MPKDETTRRTHNSGRTAGKVAKQRSVSGGVRVATARSPEADANPHGAQDSDLPLDLYRSLIERGDLFSGLRSALEIICRFRGWPVGTAWLPTDDNQQLQLVSYWHEDDPGLAAYIRACQPHVFARDIGIAGRVWNRGAAEWSPNLAGEDPTAFPLARAAAAPDIKTSLGVPIIYDRRVIGVLMFFMREYKEEDDRLVRIVSRLATQLGFALHHKQTEEELRRQESLLRRSHDDLEARILERTVKLAETNQALQTEIHARSRVQEQMQSRVRQLEAIAYIGARALSGVSLPTIFQETCERVAETLAVELCKVLTLEPEGKELTLLAGVGWKAGLVGRATVPASLGSQAGYTLATNKPVIVEDLRTETRFNGPSLLLDHGVVSGMSVVIVGRERPFGVLGAHTIRRRDFHPEDINFLASVAHVLSQAIERRASELAIRKSESWLRNLVVTTQDAVVSIDQRGCVVLFNPAAEQIFGYTAAEIAGRKVTLLMAEPYASEHDGYIARYETTGQARAIGRIRTVTARRKNGELFPIELSVTEISSDENVHYAAFIRDISEKVKLQAQLVESQRLAAIGTLAAKVGHELGNPLNGMSLTIQLLEQRLAPASALPENQVGTTLSRLKSEIARLNLLLRDFRALSRREKFEFRKTSVHALMTEALELELPRLSELGIEVRFDFPAGLPAVTVDLDKMKQVILNLVNNSADAMPQGGKLILRAMASANALVLEISDTGVGISPDVDIFESFFTTKPHGTGIGLAVVREMVQGHGGTVSYRSEPGNGTSFFITLPNLEGNAPGRS
jgi:PAS domain S-box-containing protein